MYGAIVGDIIGSVYERHNTNDYNFKIFNFGNDRRSRFTDDTVLTVATASALLKLPGVINVNPGVIKPEWFGTEYREFFKRFPNRGYGRGFAAWTQESIDVRGNSYGNGSAMRVSPVAWIYDDLDSVLEMAKVTALCSHSHEEGVKGAQAIASCIFMARKGYTKDDIRDFVVSNFQYDLNADIQELISASSFAACQASVPPAIKAFLDSSDYEDAIRKAVVLGGDSDTIAAMTGSIAEAYYKGVPLRLRAVAFLLLPVSMRKVIKQFESTYHVSL